jgi:drug/metabolite transporter (DMT)-like permease
MKHAKTYLGLSTLVIIGATAYNIIKQNLLGLEPMMISTISLFLAMLVLWLLHFLLHKKMQLSLKKLLTLSIGGLLGIAGFHFYISMALEEMNLDVALLFMGGIPLMTLVGTLLIGKKTRFRNIFWVFFALFGVLFINFKVIHLMMFMPFMPKTIGMMLLASLCLVFYTLFNERMSMQYDLREIVTIQVTTGTMILMMSFLYKMETLPYVFKALTHIVTDFKTMGSILFLALFAICVSYYLYNNGLKKVGAVMTALFINLIPVINLLYKLFLDDDQLKFTGVLGSLMILVSMYMIEDI